MNNVLVVGSTNVDFTIKLDRLPSVGETITGGIYSQSFGGKGANQAIAAARSGANVSFVTNLGDDTIADMVLKEFIKNKINISNVRKIPNYSTGTALIMAGANGENYLAVASGANCSFDIDYINTLEPDIKETDFLIIQNEIPLECIYRVIELGIRHNKKMLFNLAPAVPFDMYRLRGIYFFVVNENEASLLSGVNVLDRSTALNAARVLFSYGIINVIITLGSEGCLWVSNQGERFFSAFKVHAVDTTAAGDTFCGAMLAYYVLGNSISDCINWASAAAAICVTKLGAQSSIPDSVEIVDFLEIIGNKNLL